MQNYDDFWMTQNWGTRPPNLSRSNYDEYLPINNQYRNQRNNFTFLPRGTPTYNNNYGFQANIYQPQYLHNNSNSSIDVCYSSSEKPFYPLNTCCEEKMYGAKNYPVQRPQTSSLLKTALASSPRHFSNGCSPELYNIPHCLRDPESMAVTTPRIQISDVCSLNEEYNNSMIGTDFCENIRTNVPLNLENSRAKKKDLHLFHRKNTQNSKRLFQKNLINNNESYGFVVDVKPDEPLMSHSMTPTIGKSNIFLSSSDPYNYSKSIQHSPINNTQLLPTNKNNGPSVQNYIEKESSSGMQSFVLLPEISKNLKKNNNVESNNFFRGNCSIENNHVGITENSKFNKVNFSGNGVFLKDGLITNKEINAKENSCYNKFINDEYGRDERHLMSELQTNGRNLIDVSESLNNPFKKVIEKTTYLADDFMNDLNKNKQTENLQSRNSLGQNNSNQKVSVAETTKNYLIDSILNQKECAVEAEFLKTRGTTQNQIYGLPQQDEKLLNSLKNYQINLQLELNNIKKQVENEGIKSVTKTVEIIPLKESLQTVVSSNSSSYDKPDGKDCNSESASSIKMTKISLVNEVSKCPEQKATTINSSNTRKQEDVEVKKKASTTPISENINRLINNEHKINESRSIPKNLYPNTSFSFDTLNSIIFFPDSNKSCVSFIDNSNNNNNNDNDGNRYVQVVTPTIHISLPKIIKEENENFEKIDPNVMKFKVRDQSDEKCDSKNPRFRKVKIINRKIKKMDENKNIKVEKYEKGEEEESKPTLLQDENNLQNVNISQSVDLNSDSSIFEINSKTDEVSKEVQSKTQPEKVCSKNIDRKKLYKLIEFIEKDLASKKHLEKSKDEIKPKNLTKGKETGFTKNRRKLSKSSVVKNKNNLREPITLVKSKCFTENIPNSPILNDTLISDCTKEKNTDDGVTNKGDKAEIVKYEKENFDDQKTVQKDDKTKEKLILKNLVIEVERVSTQFNKEKFPKNEVKTNVSSKNNKKNKISLPYNEYSKNTTPKKKTDNKSLKKRSLSKIKSENKIDLMKALQKFEYYNCLSCDIITSTDNFWINVVTGDLRCLNCFKKKSGNDCLQSQENDKIVNNLSKNFQVEFTSEMEKISRNKKNNEEKAETTKIEEFSSELKEENSENESKKYKNKTSQDSHSKKHKKSNMKFLYNSISDSEKKENSATFFREEKKKSRENVFLNDRKNLKRKHEKNLDKSKTNCLLTKIKKKESI